MLSLIRKILTIFSFLFLAACSTTTLHHKNLSEKNSALEKNPTAADYNVQLGMSYLNQGDVERAKQKLLLAEKQAPQSAQTLDAMAFFSENTGDNEKAQQYYLQAINLAPTDGSAQNNYGAFLCRTKQYQQADQHFMLAVQDPNYLKTAEVYENAGLCAMQIPDNAKALGYFQKAIAQDPRRAMAYLELGQLTYQQGNYPLAQQYFDSYAKLKNDLGPEGLWLGIRLARKLNDAPSAGRYALLLQNEYPHSQEYRELLAAKKPVSLKSKNNLKL
jgi:type IV pilus assembly protein PilF